MPHYPETQLDAFREIQPVLPECRRRVYMLIAGSHNGLTLFELIRRLELPVNKVSGRVTELRKAGLIADSGDRRINPESRKNAIVWIVN